MLVQIVLEKLISDYAVFSLLKKIDRIYLISTLVLMKTRITPTMFCLD